MNNLVSFVKESWAELKQVSWLTPPQMIASTWLVIILSALMALYVGVVDYILSFILRILV
jgi:preprotein translocase SecE subunit